MSGQYKDLAADLKSQTELMRFFLQSVINKASAGWLLGPQASCSLGKQTWKI